MGTCTEICSCSGAEKFTVEHPTEKGGSRQVMTPGMRCLNKTASPALTSDQELRRLAARGRQAMAELELMRKQAMRHLQIINEIPGCHPDGSGVIAPLDWVLMAKRKLGYKT